MIFATSSFLNSFNDLNRYPNLYGSIGSDIYNLFKGKTIDDIFEFKTAIDSKLPNYRIVKCRIANSGANMAENGGFRLIFNVIKNKNTVCLLFVYPKTGKKRIENTNIEFSKTLTKTFADEIKTLIKIEMDTINKTIIFP